MSGGYGRAMLDKLPMTTIAPRAPSVPAFPGREHKSDQVLVSSTELPVLARGLMRLYNILMQRIIHANFPGSNIAAD
jgi:hypothetical protein